MLLVDSSRKGGMLAMRDILESQNFLRDGRAFVKHIRQRSNFLVLTKTAGGRIQGRSILGGCCALAPLPSWLVDSSAIIRLALAL